MFRRRGIILLGVAGFLAIVTVFLVRGMLAAQRPAAPVEMAVTGPVEAVHVLVAKDDIGPGEFVRPEDLRWQSWPDDQLAPAYAVQGMASQEDFIGAVARTRIVAGEPITAGRVVRPGERSFLAAVLTPGMRAISVPVNATSGISGFIFPGDKVDVILTHALRKQKDGQVVEHHASETVLHDVRVLAVDQTIDDLEDLPKLRKTATLEVSPKDAEVVSVMNELGKLSLILRSLAREKADGTPIESKGRHTYTQDNNVSRLITGSGSQKMVHVLRAQEAEEVEVGAR